VSENLDLVRSLYADWERGEFARTDWADREIVFVLTMDLEPVTSTGVDGMVDGFSRWLRAWEGFRAVRIDEYRELDDGRVLVLGRMGGRGKASGADVESEFANLFQLRDGKVTRLVLYQERARALADLGLEE
jgi:ketosteroid isomerase-like protein